MNFSPVRVTTTTFVRDGVEEVLSAFLDVRANEQDYRCAVRQQDQEQDNTPLLSRILTTAVDPSSPDDSSTSIQVIHLTPAKYTVGQRTSPTSRQ